MAYRVNRWMRKRETRERRKGWSDVVECRRARKRKKKVEGEK